MKKREFDALCIIVGLSVCMIDQGIKLSVRKLPLHEAAFTIRRVVELSHYKNTGAAFSFLRDRTAFITIVSAALLILLLHLLFRGMSLSRPARLAVCILIGGGAGNLIDRIVFGGVTDYIRLLFIPFPVFNFADICITGAVILLMFYTITGRLDHHPEAKTDG